MKSSKKSEYPNGKPKWLRCTLCGSTDAYFRIKVNGFLCRRCGTLYRADWVNQKVRKLRIRKKVK